MVDSPSRCSAAWGSPRLYECIGSRLCTHYAAHIGRRAAESIGGAARMVLRVSSACFLAAFSVSFPTTSAPRLLCWWRLRRRLFSLQNFVLFLFCHFPWFPVEVEVELEESQKVVVSMGTPFCQVSGLPKSSSLYGHPQIYLYLYPPTGNLEVPATLRLARIFIFFIFVIFCARPSPSLLSIGERQRAPGQWELGEVRSCRQGCGGRGNYSTFPKKKKPSISR